MRKTRLISSTVCFLLLFIISCTPQATPTPEPTLIPVELSPQNGDTAIYFDLSPVVYVEDGDFWMYRSLVSNGQYQDCVDAGECTAGPSGGSQSADFNSAGEPVTGVTIEQARSYCTWMGGWLPIVSQLTAADAAFAEASISRLDADKGYYVRDPSSTGPAMRAPDGTVQPVDLDATVPDVGITCTVTGGGGWPYAPVCTMRPIDPESLMGLDAIPPSASCVQPVIEELGHYCVGGSPYVNIDVSGTTTWKALTLDGVQTMECQEDLGNSSEGKIRLVCTGEPNSTGYLRAMGKCTAPSGITEGNVCLDGYEYDPAYNMCIYKHGLDPNASACPVGYTFSTELSCCAPVTKDYVPLCPPNQFYFSDDIGCLSYDTIYENVFLETQFGECSQNASGGGGGASCSLSCPSDCEPNATCTACQGIGGGSCKP